MTYTVEPVLTIKKFTVREVYEAIEKNGFEHLRGHWFIPESTEYGQKAGACVLGQAALNLNVDGRRDTDKDDNGDVFSYSSLNITVLGNAHPTVYSQLNRFAAPTDAKWAISSYAHENYCGDIIVTWNDKLDDNHNTYVLRTYQEVADMAKDVLEPFFDEVVYLRVMPEGVVRI